LHAFIKKSGLDMVRVPYRNPIEALTDTVNGRVHIYWAAHAIVQAQVQAGNVKVIAITNSEPTSLLPGIPTVTQAGFPDLTLDGLIGIFGQRDLPQSARERIAADVKTALDDPSIRSRLTATGQIVVPGSSAELAASIAKQRAGLVEVAKVLGIREATQ
jgi:tripartite-type tricarboxylate transporter receptor subunit TctC